MAQVHFVTAEKDGKVKTLYAGTDFAEAERAYDGARLDAKWEHASLFQNAMPRLTCSPATEAKQRAADETRSKELEAQKQAAELTNAQERVKNAEAELEKAKADLTAKTKQ